MDVKTIEVKLPESRPAETRRDDARRPPTDRFDFRGEHAGTIYTSGGWRRLNVDPSMIGPDFLVPFEHNGGQTFYVPFARRRSGYGQGYGGGRDREFIGLGASYEIVRPRSPVGSSVKKDESPRAGRWELRAEEVPVPGEFIEVYHPAVYEVDEEGNHQLVEAAETTRVPKVKIVLRKIWVER